MNNCILSLIRAVLCGTDVGDIDVSDSAGIGQLYRLGEKHDLAHLVGTALMKAGLARDSAWFPYFRRAGILALTRYAQQEETQRQLRGLLCGAQVPFIFLKGASIRAYYPEPEMRTGCDIDVLIHPEDIGGAAQRLTDAGYRKTGEGGHDVRFTSPCGVLVEMHFTLMEERQYPKLQPLLKRVWEYASSADTDGFCRTLTPEFAYFYHIAHMIKHYVYGGCGIRTLMDLWVLRHRGRALDETLLDSMLAEADITVFEGHVRTLAEYWFSGIQPDPEVMPLYEMMEEYILTGGIYGSVENRVKVGQLQSGGKLRYLWSRVFVPRSRLKYDYPILERYPILLPFCEVRRWCRLLSRDTADRIRHEVRCNRALSSEAQDAADCMLRCLGLR